MGVDLSGLKKLKNSNLVEYEYFSDLSAEGVPYVQTNLYPINFLLTGKFNDTIKEGRFIGLASRPHVGKSFIALTIIKEAQKAGYTPVIFDSEGTLDKPSLERVGIDTSDGGLIKVFTAEHLKEVFMTLAESNKGKKLIFLLDSLGNLGKLKDAENTEFKDDQGQLAKKIKGTFKPISGLCAMNKWPFIITTHLYDSPDIFSAAKPVGGNHFQHICNYILFLSSKFDAESYMSTVTVTCSKTRDTHPFCETKFVIDLKNEQFLFGTGYTNFAIGCGLAKKVDKMIYFEHTKKKYFEKTLAFDTKVQENVFTPEFLEKLEETMNTSGYLPLSPKFKEKKSKE